MTTPTRTTRIQVILVEAPAAAGPYGAKGAGEVAGIPTVPAITSAIRAATGVHITRLPVGRLDSTAGGTTAAICSPGTTAVP